MRYEVPGERHGRASPAIGADGTIYFAAETGYIYALDSEGSLLWRENFHNTINWSSPMLLDDGTLYVGGNRNQIEGRLVAVRTGSPGLDLGPWPRFRGNAANTGRVRWATPVQGASNSGVGDRGVRRALRESSFGRDAPRPA